MTRILFRIGCLLIVTQLLYSCVPLYRASIPNQPILKQRHDTEIEVGIETGSAYVNASYAFTNNMFVTVGGNSWTNRHTSSQYGEIGFGFFKAQDNEGFSLGFNAGYGTADVLWTALPPAWFDPWWNETTAVNVEFARLSIQPGYYYYKGNHSFSFAIRNSLVNWISPTNFNEQTTGSDFFMDPVISYSSGSTMTKFFGECSLQIPIVRSYNHANIPIHLGFGVAFYLSKGMTQPKSE